MFPAKRYLDAGAYTSGYFRELARASSEIETKQIERAAAVLHQTMVADRAIFACGNGGSAAISNHLLCDFSKGVQTGTSLRPRVISLSSHVELITAIGNDISFDDIFSYQLRTAARPGDVLFSISSSGDSANIVRSVEWAQKNDVRTIALTGFTGGRSAALSEINIHVPSENYGIVEDLHQSIMHILAQFVRMQAMPESSDAYKF